MDTLYHQLLAHYGHRYTRYDALVEVEVLNHLIPC